MRAGQTTTRQRQRGFSYLELQVSMVLFAIALGGIGPLAIVHSRHIRRVEARFPPDQLHLLTPAPTVWQRKLGIPAERVDVWPARLSDALVIDDGGVGYSQVNRGSDDWYYWRWSQVYDNDMRFNYGDDRNDRAVWRFDDLLPGRYEVMATWRPFSFLARDARYELFDGNRPVGSEVVDQRSWPSGPTIDGFRWERLDTVDVTKDSFRVELRDGNRDYIAVDAVRLVPVLNELEVTQLVEDPGSESSEATIRVRSLRVR